MRKLFAKMASAVGLTLTLGLLGGCFHQLDLPDVSWNRSADAKVVQATFCCGFVPYTYALNAIPDAQIWGDGRMVWSFLNENGERVVMEGQLTASDIESLLNEMARSGFFGWQDLYANTQVADVAEQCIWVQLSGLFKQVCEYFEGAPPAFHNLYEKLTNGLGKPGTTYTPTRAFLVAHQLDGVSFNETDNIHWPGNASFGLQEAINGKWIEGDLLAFAWDVVNKDLWWGAVSDIGQLYQLTVQVPDLVDFALD